MIGSREDRKGIVKKILIADDVEFNRDVLGEIFGKQYDIRMIKAGECGAFSPELLFEAAHAFKGVAGNIGLTKLYNAASELTEQLRGCQEPADPQLVDKIRAYYDEVQEKILEL